MLCATPALDHFTESVRRDFHASLSRHDEHVRGGPAGMTTGEMLTGKAAASPVVTAYLQLEPRARLVIPKLVLVNRVPHESGTDKADILMATAKDPVFEGLGKEIWENLSDVVDEVYFYLIGLVADMLRALPDANIGALLVDLWHVADEEFDSENPENMDDYNIDDLLPTSPRETPHLYLIDLVMDAVIVRLMKRHGPELLLTWSDAVRSVSPA
jgi:hypothetical protein